MKTTRRRFLQSGAGLAALGLQLEEYTPVPPTPYIETRRHNLLTRTDDATYSTPRVRYD